MKARRAALSVLLAFGLLQFAPGEQPATRPVIAGNRIEANVAIPEHVKATIRKACQDCHSYETRLPWYAQVVPFSWLVASDIRRARKAMNFSDWPLHTGRKRLRAIGTLAAACAGVQSGRMPPATYRLMHPEARLTADEAQAFCEWTATAYSSRNAVTGSTIEARHAGM